MTAIFYNCSDDGDHVHKSPEPTRDDVTITQYMDTSIINPVFRVKTVPTNTNYLYVNDTGRYYYIDDMVYSNQCILLYCTIDVLYTYRDDIINSTQLVARNENDYNDSLPDNFLPVTCQTQTCVDSFGIGLHRANTIDYIIGVI